MNDGDGASAQRSTDPRVNREAVFISPMIDHTVISVAGTLDESVARDFAECVDGLLKGGCRRLIVDPANLRIVEFTGAEVLVAVLISVRARGVEIVLAPSTHGAYKALDRLGNSLAPTSWSSVRGGPPDRERLPPAG